MIRAFDRNDKRINEGDEVTVVQGELGYDHDMAEVAKVEHIVSSDEVKIRWPDNVYMYIHPYDLLKADV